MSKAIKVLVVEDSEDDASLMIRSLQRGGFEFHFPEWPDAARDLCRRWQLAQAKKSIP